MSNTPPIPEEFNHNQILEKTRQATTIDELYSLVRDNSSESASNTEKVQQVLAVLKKLQTMSKGEVDWSNKNFYHLSTLLGQHITDLLNNISSDPSSIIYMVQKLATHEINHVLNHLADAFTLLRSLYPLSTDEDVTWLNDALEIALQVVGIFEQCIILNRDLKLDIHTLPSTLKSKLSTLEINSDHVLLDFEQFLIVRTLVFNALSAAETARAASTISVGVDLVPTAEGDLLTIDITDNIGTIWTNSARENLRSGYEQGLSSKDPYPLPERGMIMSAYRTAQKGGTIELIDNEPEGFKKIRIRLPL